MDPYLSKNDKQMFYKYLDKKSCYFEYGSGGSTYQASLRDNIVKIYSVESDVVWQEKLKQNVKTNNITYIMNDMDAKPNTWGHPGKNATDAQKRKYSDQIRRLSKEELNQIDMILIDGRFRVACCLKCHDVITDDCIIAFDDFLNRKQYHVVLKYFNIEEKTEDNRMVILSKNPDLIVPDELIKKYELIAD